MSNIIKALYGIPIIAPAQSWKEWKRRLDKGSEKVLKVLLPIGQAFTSVTGNLVNAGNGSGYAGFNYNKGLSEQHKLQAAEKIMTAVSPSNHVVAWIQGSLNPAVGLKKIAEWGPAALLGSFITDIAAFKYAPKAMKNTPAIVDKGLAAAGNKGAKSRVVAREMDKTFKGSIDLKELSNHYVEPYVTNPKGSGKLVHYDNGDRASVFRNSGSYIQDGHLYPGLTTKNLGNFTWWNKDNPYINVHKSKGKFSPSRYIVVDETNQFVHPLKAGKTVGQSDGAGRGFILPGEVVSESPVNLSNAFILEKDPFGWWNNIKVVKNPAQQATHPWQLSNSKYSRFLQSNGNVRLQLNLHTEAKPRQFVLEPQGDNKYYVHMRVWDDVDKKVPATMSSADKNTLLEALYNELPDGAEILFPKSGPGNYGTRGTVAGLLHLSRDPRFTPGTRGTLLYTDKDGKTVKIYEGTSSIKRGENLYSREPVVRGKDYEDYVTRLGDEFLNHGAKVKHIEPDPELTKIADRVGFTPVFLMWPGARLRAHSKEIIRRLQLQGMDVDRETASLPMAGLGTVREVINKNAQLPSLIGYFHKTGVTGLYNKKTGITLVDPTEYNKTVSTMQHERNMHGTERILTPSMWNPYERFLHNIFGHGNVNIREVNNKKYYSITDPENISYEHPITGGALKKEELRATLGLYRKNLYDNVAYPRARADGVNIPGDDLEPLRPYFEAAVDELNLPQVKMDLSAINGYGRVYAKHGPKWHSNFLEELRELLKYSPGILPFMRNEKE